MSSKGTIFLTSENEHCYNETNEIDGGFFRVYLEINKDNLKFIDYNSESGLLIGIKGDSEIAKEIRGRINTFSVEITRS